MIDNYIKTYEIKGQYNEILSMINKENEKSRYQLVELRILYKKGMFSNAYKKLHKIDKFSSKNSNDLSLIEFKLIETKINLVLNKMDTVDNLLKQIKIMLDDYNNKYSVEFKKMEADYYNTYGLVEDRKSHWKNAINYYKKSLKIFDIVGDNINLALVYHNYGNILQKIGDYNNAMQYLYNSLDIRKNIGNKYDILETLNSIGIIKAKKGLLDEAEQYFNNCLNITNEINDNYKKLKIVNNLGNINKIKGNYNKAIQYYTEAHNYADFVGDKKVYISANFNIGSAYIDLGNLDQAIQIYVKMINSINNYDKYISGIIFNNLGLIYEKKGEYSSAKIYYEKSLSIRNELGNKKDLANTIQNLGKILMIQGDFENAEKYLIKAYNYYQDNGETPNLSEITLKLGILYSNMLQNDKADKFFNESYKIRKKINNPIQLSEVLYYIILYYISNNNTKMTNKYFDKLKQISKSGQSIIILREKICEAAIMYSKPRLTDKTKSMEMFYEIIDGDLLDFELKLYSMLKLAEYLLLEYSTTYNDEILVELNLLIQKLNEIAMKQDLYLLIAQTVIFQAQILLLQTNIKKATELLDQVAKMANNRKLENIVEKVNFLRKQIDEHVSKWDMNTNISDRMNNLKVNEHLNDMYHKIENTELFLHDIKNYLQLNLNIANFLYSNEKIPDEMKEYIKLLEQSGYEMQMHITSFLITEKLHNNTYIVYPEKINLVELINERINLFNLKLKEKNLDLNIENNISEINIDRFLFSRIIDNLLHNAIKFSPKGKIIEIYVKKTGNFINFSISNDCSAIPKELQTKIFDKYKQLDRKNRGFGLGLSFCKSAVKKLGGDISIISPIPGTSRGVIFELQIPIIQDTND